MTLLLKYKKYLDKKVYYEYGQCLGGKGTHKIINRVHFELCPEL